MPPESERKQNEERNWQKVKIGELKPEKTEEKMVKEREGMRKDYRRGEKYMIEEKTKAT